MEAHAQPAPVEIPEMLRRLHQARKEHERAKAALQEKRDAWEAEHEDEIDEIDTIRLHVEFFDAAIREAALAQYEADPDREKQVCPGVGIRVTTDYDYDAMVALEWAKAHQLCVSLDRKAFLTICKADSTRPDFVTVTEKPSATIATYLSPILEVQ